MTSLEILGNKFPNNTKISYHFDQAPKSTRCYQNLDSVTNLKELLVKVFYGISILYGISYTLKSPTPQFKSHLIVDYITNA